MRIRNARPRIAAPKLIATGTSSRARRSASTSSARSRAGRAVDAVEHVLDGRGDVEEADPALEERLDGDLVGGVVGARIGAAPHAGLARERKHPEGLEVGLVELEGAELERRDRRRGALGVGERVGDRDAHVRVPEVRDRGAVAEPDHPVDDRRRVDDHLDAVVRDGEEEVRLDHLEALVGERRGVDRDLRSHRPRRVRERLLGGDVVELVAPSGRGTGRRSR